MKIIKIESCMTCPYRFVKNSLIEGVTLVRTPYCFKNGTDKALPHVKVKKAIVLTAQALHTIPDWCPLDDL